MREFRLLCKLQAKSLLGLNKARYSQDPKEKRKARTQLYVIVGLAIYMCVIYTAYGVGGMTPTSFFSSGVTVCLIFALLTAISSASNVFFKNKDYDMVMSLPASHATVVASRFFTLYLATATNMLMFVPASIYSYFYSGGSNPLEVLAFVLIILAVPLVPMALATFLSFFTSLFTSKLKRKNLLNIIFNVIMMLALFALLIAGNISGGERGFIAMIPAFGWVESGLNGNWLHVILFVAVSIAAVLVVSLIMARKYGTLYGMVNSTNFRSKYKMTALKTTSPSKALMQREWKRFTSSSTYVMNIGVSLIMGVLLSAAALVILKTDLISSLSGDELSEIRLALANPDALPVIVPIAAMILSFFMSMTSVASCSISAEGDRLWFIKSMPVSTQSILQAKLKMNFSMFVTASLLNSTLLAIALNVSGLWLAVIYIVPLAHVLFSGMFGQWINLCFPKLDWKNDIEFVKQGASMVICMFVGMGICAIPVVALIATQGMFGSSGLFIGIWAAVILAASFLLYRLCMTKGAKKFDKL